MKFKKILVSDDNQLVIGDYGLNESDVEIIDLNKSLHDIAEDPELREFIIQNIVNKDKIYIVCVKEDFGTNEQIIEEIKDIKDINKTITKAFKKIKNLYFFVYNTFMKNESAINPSLDQPSAFAAKEAKVLDAQNAPNANENQDIDNNAQTLSGEQELGQEVQHFENVNSDTVYHDNQFNEIDNLEHVKDDLTGVNDEQGFVAYEQHQDENTNQNQQEEHHESISVANEIHEGVEEIKHDLSEHENHEQEKIEASENAEEKELEAPEPMADLPVEVVDAKTGEATSEQAEGSDIEQLDEIIEQVPTSTHQDDAVRENIETTTSIHADLPEVTSEEIFDEKQYGINDASEFGETPVNLGDVESIAAENNKPENDSIVFNNKLDDSVDMPESYFDIDNQDDISYEDYNEFVNDYELNVHALKSIYDFIWRILVLNNYNLKLNDLLYIAVNNLDAFSIGQSDFVRQTANKAESLFDLILQLDIKLEFNNSLFYIYLAQFFSISGNKIIVNPRFLDTLSIWVDKASKKRFVEQIEQFMNYSSIYNKKIIFSYFIELANFIKGCLPTIRPSITLVDIHRILTNPTKKVRKENVFGFMVDKINQIFKDNGIVAEMYLVETPENMFGIQESMQLDETSESWKTQLTILYKKLVENIQNYILLKGNKETEIFNIYIDIKDLRMYKSLDSDKNLLSPETIDAISRSNVSHSYLTIGDALNRESSIVPSQVSDDRNLDRQYLNTLERGIDMNNNFKPNKDFIETSSEMQQYPETVVLGPNQRYESNSRTLDSLRSKYASRFNMSEFENAMSKRIEEYEKKIKDNIARIEAERKQLRQKMEDLKNI